MTTTDTRPAPDTEFERIAALTIKATEAVAEELRTDGDAHTCVTATMGVFQPEIDRLKAEVERLRAVATNWYETYQEHAASFDDFLGELLALLPGAEDTGSDAYDQIPRAIEALRADRDRARAIAVALEQEQADAWVVPKVPVDANPHVRPRILPNGLIRRDAGDSTPAHTLQYVGQLLAAVDEVGAQAKETGQ